MLTTNLLTLIGRREHADIAKNAASTQFNTVHFYSAAKELTLLIPKNLQETVKSQIKEIGSILTFNSVPYKVVYK